jgi:hypothetical protein
MALCRRRDQPEPDPVEYWRPAYQLVLEEARRSIDRQLDSLREVRQRAGNLIGYASVVAAALGFSAADDLRWPSIVALIAFLVVAGAALYVLFPRTWHLDLRAQKIDDWIGSADNEGIEHMIRSLAMAHDENYAGNLVKVDRLHLAIMAAVVALVVEAIALVLQLVL